MFEVLLWNPYSVASTAVLSMTHMVSIWLLIQLEHAHSLSQLSTTAQSSRALVLLFLPSSLYNMESLIFVTLSRITFL